VATALPVALVYCAALLAILQMPRFEAQELPRAPSARSKVSAAVTVAASALCGPASTSALNTSTGARSRTTTRVPREVVEYSIVSSFQGVPTNRASSVWARAALVRLVLGSARMRSRWAARSSVRNHVPVSGGGVCTVACPIDEGSE
jgi:hypothetical protein